MISAELLAIAAWLVGAGFLMYGFLQSTPADSRERKNALYAFVIAALCLAAGFGLNAYSDSPPVPVPPAPGPAPPGPGPGPAPPTPNPPTPSTFTAAVQAAWKADGRSAGLARDLGAMAQRLGQAIAQQPQQFKTTADIGAAWESYRGQIFQPMGKWCPLTTEAQLNEMTRRGLATGPITNHAEHATLWAEFGQALLSYQ